MPEDRHRLVVLGSSRVGKTSIIRQFLNKEFSEKYKETVEDIYSKRIKIQDEVIPLEILDTNFNFPDMRKVAIASASAFLLVFAVDNVQSFKEMSDMWTEICENRSNIREVPTVVAGNKADLPTKKIFEATATAWTSRLNANIRYLETSAKTSENITNVFKTLLEISGLTYLKELVCSAEAQPSTGTALADKNSTRRNEDFNRTDSVLSIPSSDDQLRRNRSLRVKSEKTDRSEDDKKGEKNANEDGSRGIRRSKSLIRRTKHLSLKIRKSAEKQADSRDENSDCRIS